MANELPDVALTANTRSIKVALGSGVGVGVVTGGVVGGSGGVVGGCGQGPALQSKLLSLSTPVQLAPPPEGGGFVQVLVLFCFPCPHDTLQGV